MKILLRLTLWILFYVSLKKLFHKFFSRDDSALSSQNLSQKNQVFEAQYKILRK